jgi:hypothetical protein
LTADPTGIDDTDDVEEEAEEVKPDTADLTDRERIIVSKLQEGADLDALASRLNTRETVVERHIDELRDQGWDVYKDDTASKWVIADDEHTLRSAEHKGTRTRKANQWWERTHSRLQRNYKRTDGVDDIQPADTHADESLVLHLTDLHIGDYITRPSDNVEVYNTPIAVAKAEYAARKAIEFAQDRKYDYDVGWLLLGGDEITCEAIYEGQFENLDRWLNGQLNAAADAMFRVVAAFADYFPQVNIICQTGNHGQIRASGSSRQMNGDLLLYERLRNILGIHQMLDDRLSHVYQSIGEPGRFYDFKMRGGEVTGHLRHGDDDRQQNTTAAAKRDWRGRALTHDFDIGWIGHHHVYRHLTVNQADAFVTPSPKPPGDFAEKLATGGEAAMDGTKRRKIATVHGVNEYGVTDVRGIDTRDYTADLVPADDDIGIPSPDPVPGAVGPDIEDIEP